MTALAPRLLHNLSLSNEFAHKFPLPQEIRPIHEQLKTVEVNRRALFPFGYNPSIIRFNGRLLMAYRWHDRGDWRSSLAMAELDNDFNVTSNKAIKLPGESNEDPRLFEFDGQLWMAYVTSRGWTSTATPTCEMRYGMLTESTTWSVVGQYLIKYASNGSGTGMQKNWVPFVHDGKIHFIYSMSPEQRVIAMDDPDKCITNTGWDSKPVKWTFGRHRGGTSPISYKGKWIRFVHSRLDNEPGTPAHRYYIGAVMMEPEHPFNVISCSKRPIARASEEDSTSTTERSSCVHHKKNVVFPLGAIEHGEGWIVSVGINDFMCALMHVQEKDLNL